jgi:hypothetical protein
MARAEPTLSCPYCGEAIEVYVDPGGGEQQEYIEDCSVCCRPIRLRARWREVEYDDVVEALAEDE